jgi:hypothetical protein
MPDSPPPADSATPAQHGVLAIFSAAVTAGATGIGGLLLAIFTQRPGVIVPWALFVLGLSAFAPIIPQVPRMAQLWVVVVIAVALVSSSIVVWQDPRLLTHTRVRTVSVHRLTPPKFSTDIKLAAIPAPIPFCNTFSGTGTIPSGYQLWIFDKNTEDPTAKYYLDSQATAIGNTWSASNIQIGNGTGDAGTRTTIYAVLLPANFMNWLVHSVNITSGIPSASLPAGAHVADEAIVTRNSNIKPCRF